MVGELHVQLAAVTLHQAKGIELAGVAWISDPLVKVLVILGAVTGMRISEALALTWDAINWTKGKSHIRRKWNGKSYGPPKSLMIRKPVVMTKGLGTVLEVWRQETMFAEDADLLFPSYRKKGQTASAWQHDRRGLYSSCGYRCEVLEKTQREVLLRR